MSSPGDMFNSDIVLDEAAFDKAVADFAALSQQLEQLRTEVADMVSSLKAGFDTPAGNKFISACEANLFQPLDAQKLVLEHISETLSQSKQAYQSVFREYEALQTAINQVGQT